MANSKLNLSLIACVLIISSNAQDVDPNNYIIGGQTARPNQFPFIVSLRGTNNQHFCGGGIISDRWILSAAHCTQDDFARPQNVIAVVGAHHRQNDGVPIRLDGIVNHPRYNARFMTNDICVLRTAAQIQFQQGRVQALQLPTGDYVDSQRQRVWIAGWGLVRVSKTYIQNSLSEFYNIFNNPDDHYNAICHISVSKCKQQWNTSILTIQASYNN